MTYNAIRLPCANATALTAVLVFHWNNSFPVCTSHSLQLLSADPVNNRVLSSARTKEDRYQSSHIMTVLTIIVRLIQQDLHRPSRFCPLTADVQVPNRSVVPVVATKSLPVMREPNVRFVVLRGGKEEISVPVVFYFCQ